MKLQFLGTAAAEGWPATFCNCDVCAKTAKLGGKNIRTRSQAIINDDLLIDLPPDTYMHKLTQGLDLSRVKHLLVTHPHMDHLYPQELTVRGGCYAHDMVEPDLHIYTTEEVKQFCAQVCGIELEQAISSHLQWHFPAYFQPFQADSYTVTPLKARHFLERPAANPFFYLIEQDDKRLLYCHDTGQFYPEVWAYLAEHPVHLDCISFDCTNCNDPCGAEGGHMGFPDVKIVHARLKEMGLCDDKTICILNHFSHNGRLLHDELCAVAEPEGFLVSYDGFTVEF